MTNLSSEWINIDKMVFDPTNFYLVIGDKKFLIVKIPKADYSIKKLTEENVILTDNDRSILEKFSGKV
jgi:hypothetical protein